MAAIPARPSVPGTSTPYTLTSRTPGKLLTAWATSVVATFSPFHLFACACACVCVCVGVQVRLVEYDTRSSQKKPLGFSLAESGRAAPHAREGCCVVDNRRQENGRSFSSINYGTNFERSKRGADGMYIRTLRVTTNILINAPLFVFGRTLNREAGASGGAHRPIASAGRMERTKISSRNGTGLAQHTQQVLQW